MSKQGPLAGPNPASGPYINHHMSSGFTNMYFLSYCPSRLSGSTFILIFCVTNMQNIFCLTNMLLQSLVLLIHSTLRVIRVLSSVKHCMLSLRTFCLCLWWCVQFKVRNVFSCQGAFRLWDYKRGTCFGMHLLYSEDSLCYALTLQLWHSSFLAVVTRTLIRLAALDTIFRFSYLPCSLIHHSEIYIHNYALLVPPLLPPRKKQNKTEYLLLVCSDVSLWFSVNGTRRSSCYLHFKFQSE